MHIKSKSHCLILDSFIEKIVEQLPKEIKYKRGVTIKDRNKKMKRKYLAVLNLNGSIITKKIIFIFQLKNQGRISH